MQNIFRSPSATDDFDIKAIRAASKIITFNEFEIFADKTRAEFALAQNNNFCFFHSFMQAAKKSLFRRIVGPPAKWVIAKWALRRIRKFPHEGEYSAILRNAMRFIINGEIEGDYLEFGVSKGATITAAYHHARWVGLNSMRFFAFDSFEGLPEITGVDADGRCHYHQGQYACGLERFKKNLSRDGVDLSRIKTIEGWYDKTLNDNTKKLLGIQKAAVIWIDCDLYESTVPALNFITDYVQTGTIICFDDFYCFRGDPNRGECKAFNEWLARNPKITAVEYQKFEAAGNSYILNVAS